MDKIDKKLLRLLQENARYSLKQLSEKVYLSSPAVAARIEKLEEEGIITGYHADISLDKMGYHITAFINLEMTPKQKASFIPFIAEVPNVIECNTVSGGSTSMLMKVSFPSTSESGSVHRTASESSVIPRRRLYSPCRFPPSWNRNEEEA